MSILKTMQVFHSETLETENKPSREAGHKNLYATENNNMAIIEASSEQIEASNAVVKAPKPRQGMELMSYATQEERSYYHS